MSRSQESSRAKTMKKFKPPFKGDGYAIVDSDDEVFVILRHGFISEDEGDRLDTVVNALNFYYANKREQSERKGEKE